jgi:hypothetical protein
VGIVLVLLEGVHLWRSTGGPQRAAKPRPSAVPAQRGSGEPAAGTPRWLGHPGITGQRIAGIVVGEDGTPVVGASVRLASVATAAGLVVVPPAKTDTSGAFDLGVHPAATYVVSAEQPKLTAATLRVDLRDPTPSPPSDRLKLVMHACTASIHGTVFDMAEGAIGGATVVREERDLPVGTGVTADDKGGYELCVPPGSATVIVSADGYAAIREDVDVYGRTRRDFRLTPGTSISGKVIRADDKSPVADAILELVPADRRDSAARLSAASAADGTFHFENVAPGRHTITAEAERLATTEPVEVTADIGVTTTDVVVEMSTTYRISGRVREAGSKKPVAGRGVFLMTGDRSWGRGQRTGSISQSDGTFTIDHVRPGEYRAFVDGASEPPPIVVDAADVTGVDIEVEATATVSGRVLAGGKPVDGVNVRIERWAATSEADGRYTIRGVGAGTHEIYAESKRVGAFTRDRTVTVTAGEDKTGVDIELDLAGSIAGVVVDQDGAPVPGVFLSFSLVRGKDFGSATTADDGTFTARALSGGGDYVYEVRQRDGSAIVLPPATGKRFPPVAVENGQTHVTGVRVQIRYEALAITGRVTGTDGKPVADATVRAVPQGMQWFRVPSTTSDQTGAFTLRDLSAGTYTVNASGTQGDGSVASIAAGAKNVAIRLLAPGRIDGTLKGFTKTPTVTALGGGVDSFERFRASVTGSTFTIRNVPPGKYTVQAMAGAGGAERATAVVEVAVGQVQTVTLTVQETGIVTGTVTDAKTHAPVAGLTCMAVVPGGDDFDFGGRSRGARTDASGAFRIERAPVGQVQVGCMGRAGNGWAPATVKAGQPTTVAVTVTGDQGGDDDEDKAGRSGMTLENQLSDVIVASVAKDSPAARAGVQLGDVVSSVDGKEIGRYQAWMAMKLVNDPAKKEVKLVLERKDKPINASLTFDAN